MNHTDPAKPPQKVQPSRKNSLLILLAMLLVAMVAAGAILSVLTNPTPTFALIAALLTAEIGILTGVYLYTRRQENRTAHYRNLLLQHQAKTDHDQT